MSSLVQDFLGVPELVQKYGLKAFVETGCENGMSLGVAKACGLALYSCDVNAEKVALCRDRFPVAQISHATSLDFLRDVVPQLTQPALFWLDAHFSPLAGDQQWPLKAELQIIAEYFRHNALHRSVILCDDFATVMHQQLEDPDLSRFQGAPGFCDYTAADLIAMFPYHQAKVIAQNTGVLMLTPRTT